MSFKAPPTDASVKAFISWDPQLGAGFFFRFCFFFFSSDGSLGGAMIKKDNQDDYFPLEVQLLCFYFLTRLLIVQQVNRSLQLCVSTLMFKFLFSCVTSFAHFNTNNCVELEM